jgi:hypothetical protein
MPPSSIPATLAGRTAILKGLYRNLRKHHFGIDNEIQQLLDAFAPWYQFAETQTRPRAIGLWGMTGTGKSSIVRALVKESGLEDRTYWLDAGGFKSGYALTEVFTRMEEHLYGAPFILVVDEFQYARTIEAGIPVEESDTLRRFWELLDSGRAVTWPSIFNRAVMTAKDLEGDLQAALDAGINIRNGRVVGGITKFRELVTRDRRKRSGDQWAIPEVHWRELRELLPEPKPTQREFQRLLSNLDGPGILDLLAKLHGNAWSSRVVDASKALVILLGNLDELYVGGKEPLAELDPDVLLHRHLDIGCSGVHHALLKLFRIEQVARMGNSHVVFPPIGKATVDSLVHDEVAGLAARLSAHCGLTIEVDDGLVQLIRSAAPIAVLGARPLVQAVQNTLPLLLTQAINHPSAAAAVGIRFAVMDGAPMAEIDLGTRRHRMKLSWPQGQAVPSPHLPDRTQRIAIHEVGHLLCGVLLCGKRPLQACSRTRDPHIGGFVVWDQQPGNPLVRASIVPELAQMLGGCVAEQLHYGPEGVSVGNDDDLQKATAFALEMVKNQGLGMDRLHHARHATHNGGGFRTQIPDVEAQARKWINDAEALAMATLRKHKALFDHCVEQLIEKGSMGSKELEHLLETEGTAAYFGNHYTEETCTT